MRWSALSHPCRTRSRAGRLTCASPSTPCPGAFQSPPPNALRPHEPEKYPGENDYNSHLSKYTGSSNAYTSTDATVYFFDVAPPGFPGALDRFAQFFICPLFNESAVEREIKAVNSEHMKNLQSDGWRLMQLERSLSKDGHPYKKFGTGSLETLWTGPKEKGVNVRDELIRFHER